MKLAVFTSLYPGRTTTFFERDMRGLLEAGVDLDIFSIYPLNPELWRYALGILDDRVLPRERIHHIDPADCLRHMRPAALARVATLLRDAAAITASAVRHGPGPLAKSAYVLPKAWAWAAQFPDRYDHVLAYWGNYAGTCAYVFHRLTNPRVPFSVWLHAGTDLYFRPVFLRQKLLYADNIVTCCAFNRRFIGERFPDVAGAISQKIHVCYHGLDLSTFPYEPGGRPTGRIIAVGRLAADKGFDYLLRAIARLRARGVEATLELVGDGPEAAPLRRLARELGIAERVTLRGWLHFTDVRAAMRQATVLVHPSAGLGDGLPNVIREAMALGTPVIASRVAGIPEALDDGRCGMLVPTKDAGALADALATLLADEGLRRTYAQRAREWTEQKFDALRNGARLADHLRSVRRHEHLRRAGAPALSNRTRGLAEAREP
jgi:glycosyltransferase involved in cell wall biosynthesis